MRRAVATFVRGVDALTWAAAVVAAALLIGISCAVFYEVVVRALGAPTEWSLELTTYALVWCGFVGAAYTLKNGRHVRVDLLVERLSPRTARHLELVADVVALAFCMLMVLHGIEYVHLSWVNEATSVSPLRVPLFIPQAAVPVGMALLSLQLLARVVMHAGLTIRNKAQ